ncbi:FtsX-like permease family protein [Microbacterium sp. NPDC058389]|uniref:FtsX-like permease family protein n=1 Tax=Microbacterium sp. NPDC058389 TaxID=3346475 RepID=UPI00364909E5
MTGVLDAPVADLVAEPRDAATRGRSSAWARWRVAVRLARRQVWRAKGASALVMALVALPVAGLSGAAIVWQSNEPTPEQRAALELGGNAAWIEALDNADPTRWQSVDQPWDNDVVRADGGRAIAQGGPVPDDPAGLLPPGTELFTVVEGSLGVETATGEGWLSAVSGDVWRTEFDGRYRVLDGATPSGRDEAMASPGALERLGVHIGDRVQLIGADRALTITGTLRSARDEASVPVLYVAEADVALVGDGYTRWYTPQWQPDLDGLADLNHAGFVAFAHDLVVDPPPGARLSPYGTGRMDIGTVLLVGTLIAVFSGYVVVLLAGAAFSVGARRQQRALAMAASVGAARGDVFRIVLLQGTVLGALGALVGTLAGAAAGGVFLAATDRGAQDGFWGNFGFRVPWALLAAIAVFAVLVGTLSAIVPAHRATAGDVLGALRGARRPAVLRPRRPIAGLVVLATGLAATVAGALVMAEQLAAEPTNADRPLFYAAVWAVVLGPFVFQVGLLIPSHWVLVQLSRPLSRLGLAPRIASRDAAATPSRVVPAFAVIGACVFAASVAVSATALTSAGNARQHYYSAPLGAVALGMWQDGDEASDALLAAAEDVIAATAPSATALASTQLTSTVDGATDPGVRIFAAARQRYTGCVGSACLQPYDAASGVVYVVEPDDVATLLGTDPGAAALRTLASGGAILTQKDYAAADAQVVITEWDARGYDELMSSSDRDAAVRPAASHELDAALVDVGRQQPFEILIAPATAAGLGMQVVPSQLIATYDAPLDVATIERISAQTRDLRVGPSAGVWATVELGPAPADPWLWLIVGIAVALVAGASAVALGLARLERRPDDATLAAIGGGPMMRRSINAWQAAVISAIGTVLGTAAGYVSMWGFATANAGFFDVADMPWPWLALLALGLPAAIVLAAWLVPPRHPDLTRRTVIT